MLRHTFSIVALTLLGASALCVAADKPNLAGNWKLDTAKSEFGAFPAPQRAVIKIDHQEPKLNVRSEASTDMGEQVADLKLLTNGTETTNDVGGTPVKTTAKWDDRILTSVSKVSTDSGDVIVDDRWILSDDGKTLTIERKWSGAAGDTTQKLVHTKEQ